MAEISEDKNMTLYQWLWKRLFQSQFTPDQSAYKQNVSGNHPPLSRDLSQLCRDPTLSADLW